MTESHLSLCIYYPDVVQVYEFNVPTFGKGVVFDVDHKVCLLLSIKTGASMQRVAASMAHILIVPQCRSGQNSSSSLQRP